MASIKFTVGAVLGTVTDAAAAISTTVGTASAVVGIVDTYVKGVAVKQAFDQRIDMLTYKQRRVEEAAVEDMQRQVKTTELVNSLGGEQLFEAALAKYKDLM